MSIESSTTNKTKLHICNTFIDLIEEKPLIQITVSEIIKKSNISRQTFYRHFDDIYDLLLWIFDHTATGCTIYDENKDFEESSVHFFSNLTKYPKLYQQLFLYDKNDEFSNKLLRSRIKYAKKHIGKKNLNDMISFAIELYWSGHFYMIKKWLRQGMKESPEIMGKYAYESLPEILKKYV